MPFILHINCLINHLCIFDQLVKDRSLLTKRCSKGVFFAPLTLGCYSSLTEPLIKKSLRLNFFNLSVINMFKFQAKKLKNKKMVFCGKVHVIRFKNDQKRDKNGPFSPVAQFYNNVSDIDNKFHVA